MMDQGETRTRNASVYSRLKTDILECHYMPDERLRFDDLRLRYEVTVGPIREALMRLMSESLVSGEEHKGFRVTGVSAEQLRDITSVRHEVEALAIRWAIEKGGDEWEAAVVGKYHALSIRPMQTAGNDHRLDPEWERRHKDFHAALYQACGSVWLTQFCNLLRDQTDRYRRLWFRQFSDTRDIDAEHRALTEAVTRRNAETATTLIRGHIARTADALIGYIESGRGFTLGRDGN